jgi:hypothetical protein
MLDTTHPHYDQYGEQWCLGEIAGDSGSHQMQQATVLNTSDQHEQ